MYLPTAQLLALLAVALTVIPGLKTVTSAQDPPPPGPPAAYPLSVPNCAQPALEKAIKASGCRPKDAACICSSRKIIPSLQSAVEDSCSLADQAAVQAFGANYCGQFTTPGDSTSSITKMHSATKTHHGGHRGGHRGGHDKTSCTGTASDETPMSHTKTKTHGMATSTSKMSIGNAAQTDLSTAAMGAALAGMGWLFAEF